MESLNDYGVFLVFMSLYFPRNFSNLKELVWFLVAPSNSNDRECIESSSVFIF